MSNFKVNISLVDKRFEDSIELLLELIKVNEVNIFDIPIAEITKQYIQYVEYYQKIDPEYASEFIVYSATLMYIKSRMMLPVESDLLDEFEDPRQEIVQQLIEYQKYKQAADNLETREDVVSIDREISPFLFEIQEEEQWKEVSFDDLLKAFKKVISAPKADFIFNRPKVEFTVEGKMQEIVEELERNENISYFEYFQNYSKFEMIFVFIALLELVRLQKIFLKQHLIFGDIIIEKKNVQITEEKNVGDQEKTS